MNLFLVVFGLLFVSLGPDFTDVEVDKSVAPYLKGEPLLMETGGAKVIKLSKDKILVIGVGSTVLKDQSPKERLRAETVCRVKALASIVAEKEGVTVATVDRIDERTVITIEKGREKGKSVTEVLSVTETQAKGIAKGMAVVGRWRSSNRDTFYLAMGVFCDAKGNPLSWPAEPK